MDNNILKYQILDIRSDLKKLNTLIDGLKTTIKETILIDDKIICENELNLLKKTNNKILNQINTEIINKI